MTQNEVALFTEQDDLPIYEMTVELSVIESLGINLYSNAAAVLSELVANAYDADASKVSIDWRESDDFSGKKTMSVVVSDDGCGMSVKELNERFLRAGYKKRTAEGTLSPKWDRPFMGRKGIGKLSVFSLADVVQVFSKKEGHDANGLEIRVDDLLASIKKRKKYHPQPIPVPPEYSKKGTTLVLSSLKKKRAGVTANALRKRIARRFDVLDQTPPDEGGFTIEINGVQVDWRDRQELNALQFIWEFGEKRIAEKHLPEDIKRFVIDDNIVDSHHGWKLHGWIGTAKTPAGLVEDKDAGPLQNIIVLARKRPIQEGIIEQLNFSGLFANYVTGQIEADFLDQDDLEDIATSDRQRLIEDDERVVALKAFLRRTFVRISTQWSEARREPAVERTIAEVPAIESWLSQLPPDQQPPARKMIGTISTLEFEGADAKTKRNTLLRSGILAFERIGLRKSTQELEQLSTVDATNLLPILGAQGSYEASLWVDILRTRVEAIAKLQEITSDNEKEKVLQEHIFDKLWLLDPSWERATEDQFMEQDLRKIEPGLIPSNSSGGDIAGRIDIRYRTLSGRHVIVELKRYSVKPYLEDLVDQGRKYHQAMVNVLRRKQRTSEVQNVQVFFVVGQEPELRNWYEGHRMTKDEYSRSRLEEIGGSVFHYDRLIDQARSQYRDYLDASNTARNFERLFEELGVEHGSIGD